MIQHAYNLEMTTAPTARGTDANHGWAFGVPPGITPAQWPINPESGYPLRHGFTLRLPEDYRCHGPDIVAVSFFAAERDDVDATTVKELVELFADPPASPPADPDLVPFWEAIQAQHPRTYRMTDILDAQFAVILLTQSEFDGPLCLRPNLLRSERFHPRNTRPQWLTTGAALAYYGEQVHPADDFPAEKFGLHRVFGGRPPQGPTDYALRLTPRVLDPNAGKAPQDPYMTSESDSAYQQSFYWLDGKFGAENYRQHDWVAGHLPNHVGGTMQPVQSTPQMSPYYVEFEEYLGGHNFGGGNAQLDFKDMKFDWACG